MANEWSLPFSPQELLAHEPRSAFFSFQDQFGSKSPRQKRYYQGQFSNIYNQYLGMQGAQLRAGQAPQQSFTGMLENFPFTSRFGSLPPAARGEFPSRFAPATRSLFF